MSLRLTSRSSGSGKSSSSDNSSKKDPENHLVFREPFPEAITKCPELKGILNVPLDYDIYLDSSESHWYLMVHCNVEGGDFPYVTFEITSNKLLKAEMIPTMRIMNNDEFNRKIFKNAEGDVTVTQKDEDQASQQPQGGIAFALGVIGVVAGPVGLFIGAAIGSRVEAIMLAMTGKKPTKLDTRKTTLMELCKIAEKVRCGMGEYNLLINNCQHFCNNVLEELRLPTTPTTVGPRTTEVKDMDDINTVFKVIKQDSGEDGGEKGT